MDEWMPMNGNCKWTEYEFLEIIKAIDAVDDTTVTVREGKRDLLAIAAKMDGTKGNVVEGLANMLTKLPRLPILDRDRIGEVELQATFYDALLSEIIADQDQRVALRWANKSADEEQTDIRPDAILSSLLQHDFGYPLGFGEAKPGNRPTNQHSVNMDVFRLGITCRRSIDKWRRPNFLAFMINGYHISFFVISERHQDLYTMVEIASLDVAASISDLHRFATR
ncbi:hypothetical protein DM01DRAFT_329387 [Hesseltinella vesiculosa]|uniref:Uncharacterized protein n=1 Tax=Hesseltinella vesiculosa TaxID=101127 RepID=A0A1X2GSH7_9FUNG|nr:hypothetical protein DM01DRAFT_329387 [Hesseltinella vesiculosa]